MGQVSGDIVAVTSRAFSRHPVLREKLTSLYPSVRFNDDGTRLVGKTLVDFLRGSNKAIVSLERIDASILKEVPELSIISKYGVGLDNLDLAALESHGVRLGWRGGVNRRSVAELALTFMLLMVRGIPEAHRRTLNGQWEQVRGKLLSRKTVGIIGCGCIGKELVQLLQPFGCKILTYDLKNYADFYGKYGVTPVDLNPLLTLSDVVTLHVPYDASTHHLINADRLALLNPSAVLINTARGNIVDENALKKTLRDKKLAGAAFDVFGVEPPQDPELLVLPNFFGTTHIGGSAEEAVLAMGESAIEGLEDALSVTECLARAEAESLVV